MTFNDYQNFCLRTARREGLDEDIARLSRALKLAGEAGEVGEIIGKHYEQGHPIDVPKLIKEMGDVLWYLAVLADHYGVPLSDVVAMNVDKLAARYPDGKFSVAASLARVDVEGR